MTTPNPNETEQGRAANAAAWERLKEAARAATTRMSMLNPHTCNHEWIPLDAGLEACKLCRVVKVANDISY